MQKIECVSNDVCHREVNFQMSDGRFLESGWKEYVEPVTRRHRTLCPSCAVQVERTMSTVPSVQDEEKKNA
jgi:hypothetical protein